MINNVDTKATLINEITRRELDNRRIARAAAVEGIVLLKNNGVLPIAPGKIALYGAGAEKTIKGGTGSGEVNERYSVNIRQGLEDAGYTVATGSWLKDYIDEFNKAETDYGEMMSQKIKGFNVNQILNILSDPFIYPFGRLITDEDIAKSDTDTCIYVVARQSGEGVDKSLDKHEYTLADSELANIEKVAKSYKKTVVVINSGSSMDTSFLGKIEGIDALVFFCQQGCEGGNALADILSGKVCPSGRLTDTWAKSYDDIPFGKEYSAMGDPLEGYYKEGIFVGYRYFDTFGKEPAFPFGFGLSYTSFDISLQKAKKLGTGVQLTAKVVNKGSVVGKEVVQVYVRPPRGELGREFQMLAAFAKTGDLQPGKQEEVSLDIDLASLGAYDEKTAETVLEAGEYLVLVGKNSRDLEPWVVLKLDKKAVIAKHEHALVPDKPIEELKAGHVESAIPAGLQSFELSASDFPFIQHKYVAPDRSGDERVKQFLGKLSVNDCIEIIVGAGMFPGKKG
ncbi:MAG: glycoside hydrolase family 3 C-terminal domain-containing protein, partial [Clostridiales bacterium]|nr:glycoside hydrolase family 3 C-terminal domain-containing protein [Clostridiales bacterium]